MFDDIVLSVFRRTNHLRFTFDVHMFNCRCNKSPKLDPN